MISVLRFLTTISEIRFGSISFFVLFLRQKQQKCWRDQCIYAYLYILFHKGKELRDYKTSNSIFLHYPE